VHFLRNALDYLSRKLADDCLQELRWIYDRRELVEARRDIAAWSRGISPSPVEKPGFPAGVRGGAGSAVGRDGRGMDRT
jgi:hypothetical protein